MANFHQDFIYAREGLDSVGYFSNSIKESYDVSESRSSFLNIIVVFKRTIDLCGMLGSFIRFWCWSKAHLVRVECPYTAIVQTLANAGVENTVKLRSCDTGSLHLLGCLIGKPVKEADSLVDKILHDSYGPLS
jgi:hypothetical protein